MHFRHRTTLVQRACNRCCRAAEVHPVVTLGDAGVRRPHCARGWGGAGPARRGRPGPDGSAAGAAAAASGVGAAAAQAPRGRGGSALRPAARAGGSPRGGPPTSVLPLQLVLQSRSGSRRCSDTADLSSPVPHTNGAPRRPVQVLGQKPRQQCGRCHCAAARARGSRPLFDAGTVPKPMMACASPTGPGRFSEQEGRGSRAARRRWCSCAKCWGRRRACSTCGPGAACGLRPPPPTCRCLACCPRSFPALEDPDQPPSPPPAPCARKGSALLCLHAPQKGTWPCCPSITPPHCHQINRPSLEMRCENCFFCSTAVPSAIER